jgi:hypothetical protein
LSMASRTRAPTDARRARASACSMWALRALTPACDLAQQRFGRARSRFAVGSVPEDRGVALGAERRGQLRRPDVV